MASTLRFAVGTAGEPVSGVWHLVTQGSNVYLGASAATMGLMKLSLHASGVWTLAAPRESGITFQDGNRRWMRWTKPAEHYPGWTRGPSIAVAHIAGFRRPPVTSKKHIEWISPPAAGHLVDLAIYLAAPGAAPAVWDSGNAVVGVRNLSDGGAVAVVSATKSMTAAWELGLESIVASIVFEGREPGGLTEGFILNIEMSSDTPPIPLIFDMPLNPGGASPNNVIAASDPLVPREAKPRTVAEWRSNLERGDR